MAPWPPSARVRAHSPILVVSALLAAFITPATARAQGEPPPQRLRHLAEVQLLGGFDDGSLTPSVRATLLRRRSLGSSITFSGLFLQDELSHTGGLTFGYARSLAAGPIAVEPFGEVGAGLTDARVSTGSYSIIDGTGAVRIVERYQAVEGSAVLGGGGVSLSGLVAGTTSARLTVGYWHLAGGNGLSRGSVRFGLSLGVGRRDERWYRLATDRTPPLLTVEGISPMRPDSVALRDGTLSVLSADANGIAEVAVDGRRLEFRPADRATLERSGLQEPGVVARAELTVPFGGRTVAFVARDSAGQQTRTVFRAFGPPDRDPPVLTDLTSDPSAQMLVWPLRVLAEDFSGIAEARLGRCMLLVGHVDPVIRRDGMAPGARIVGGWGGIAAGRALLVTDRSGNQARLDITTPAPTIAAGGPPPVLLLAVPIVGAGRAGSRSVYVGGSVRDPAGGWIERVTVGDATAGLRTSRSLSAVEFGGWLEVSAETTSVVVEAVTVDGRSVRSTLDVGVEEGVGTGRLHVLIVRPFDEEGQEAWASVAALTDEADRVVLFGARAAPDRVVDALVRLQQRAGPDDVVLIHIAGRLTAEVSALEPSVELAGGALPVPYLSRLVRAVSPAATLLAVDVGGGPTWQIPLTDPPGAPVPAGCHEVGDLPASRGVALGSEAPSRLLAGLTGGADRDADGRVRVVELLDFLWVAHSGLVAHRPDAVVVDLRGAR